MIFPMDLTFRCFKQPATFRATDNLYFPTLSACQLTYLPVCPYAGLSICQTVRRAIFMLVFLSFCLTVHIFLSICRSVQLFSLYLFLSLCQCVVIIYISISIHLFTLMLAHLPIYPSVSLTYWQTGKEWIDFEGKLVSGKISWSKVKVGRQIYHWWIEKQLHLIFMQEKQVHIGLGVERLQEYIQKNLCIKIWMCGFFFSFSHYFSFNFLI